MIKGHFQFLQTGVKDLFRCVGEGFHWYIIFWGVYVGQGSG